MNQEGLAPILIVVAVAVLVGGYIWFNYSNNQTKTPTSQNSTQTSLKPAAKTTEDMSDWKTYKGTGINSGITFNHPPSMKPEVYKYTTQLYVGYTNQEWFNKINDLGVNESYSDQREKRTKLASGKVDSRQSYVIFRDENSETAQSETFNQLKAYVINAQTIYQLTLQEDNVEIFKKILSGVKLTQ